jgi:hypothetical protein
VLRAKRSRLTSCSGAEGGGMLRAKRPRSTTCSGARGDSVLRVKQSRRRRALGAKRSRAHSVGGGVLRTLAVSKT